MLPAGKKAMKLGDCQWVRPGWMRLVMSAWMEDHGSGVSGAEVGRRGRR